MSPLLLLLESSAPPALNLDSFWMFLSCSDASAADTFGLVDDDTVPLHVNASSQLRPSTSAGYCEMSLKEQIWRRRSVCEGHKVSLKACCDAIFTGNPAH